MDSQKKKRIHAVRSLLEEFCESYLTRELSEYVFRVWKQLARKRACAITRGKKEIWASAVIYAIARVNLLFDKDNAHHLPPEIICTFFGTRKRTVQTKATEIEKVCKLQIGQEEQFRIRISDVQSFVRLSNGIILSRWQAKEMGLV